MLREGDDPVGHVRSPGREEGEGSDQEVAGPLGGALDTDTDSQHHLTLKVGVGSGGNKSKTD